MPGTEVHLFNSDVLDSTREEIFICEGELDCIVLNENGFPAVGVPGTNTFKEKWKPSFDGVSTVYVCFDGDNSGRSGALRIADLVGERAKIVLLPDGFDVSEYLKDHSAEKFRVLVESALDEIRNRLSLISPETDRIELPRTLYLGIGCDSSDIIAYPAAYAYDL